MRRWKYQDQGGEHIVTEDELMASFYPYWQEQMRRAGKADLISPESCIEDWVVVHWAWEITDK